MPNKASIFRYARLFFTILVMVVAFLVIYSSFKEVYYDIPELLKSAKKSLLLFLVLFQLINYIGDSLLSKSLLAIAGFKINFRNTLKVAVSGIVGNHVAPFVGGTIVTFYSYKKLAVPAAIISFLVFSWSFFVWSSYFLFFLISLILLPNLVFKFFSLGGVIAILGSAAVVLLILLFLFRQKGERIVRIFKLILRPAGALARFFNKKIALSPKLLERFIFDFHQSLAVLRKSRKRIPELLFFSFLFYIGDILTLYFAFLVFGFHPNPILLIFGYTISLVLTLFTLMPGAPGVMEASVTVVFMKLGFPPDVVIFACLLFRIFSYWLPLPIGIFSYWRIKQSN